MFRDDSLHHQGAGKKTVECSGAEHARLASGEVIRRRELSPWKANPSLSGPTFTNCARVAELKSLEQPLKTNAKPFKFIQSHDNTFQTESITVTSVGV